MSDLAKPFIHRHLLDDCWTRGVSKSHTNLTVLIQQSDRIPFLVFDVVSIIREEPDGQHNWTEVERLSD